MAFNDKRRLERAERGLYSRQDKSLEPHVSSLKKEESFDLPRDWQDSENNGQTGQNDQDSLYFETEKAHPVLKKLLYFSLLFFAVAVGLGLYIYSRGINVVSSNNIAINITGPLSIGGGEPLSLDVAVTNDNNTVLQQATLKVDYPPEARNPNDLSHAQERTAQDFGELAPGQTAHQKIQTVLFGEQNSTKSISFTLDYRVKGSNAIFEKTKKIDIAINSSPVTVTINSLKEVNSNQDLELVVDVTSNSPSALQNILLRADYPFGFTFKNSDPKPYVSNVNIWNIGNLNPGQKKTVKIRGKMEGQDGEQRTFQFAVGTQSPSNDNDIQPVFLTASQEITISKPFIGIRLLLDNDNAPNHSAHAGRPVRGDVIWTNNLPATVYDAEISVSLTGASLDKSSVNVPEGFYKSYNDAIIWNKSTTGTLAQINPGDTGTLSFDFSSVAADINAVNNFINPQINLQVNVKGRRQDDQNVPQEILSTVSKSVKIASDLNLIPRIVYHTGPFINHGPLPPKADKETTYTVILSVTNTFNDVSAAQVTATLPPYVKWLGVVSPDSENGNISYNSSGGLVTWNIGNVPAKTGFATNPREVAFQVSFVPSISQVGSTPVLVNDLAVTGIDRFTTDTLNVQKNDLTTKLSTDIGFRRGDEVISQ